jgi:CubicO group peptidase (beta-lactamase class C family)
MKPGTSIQNKLFLTLIALVLIGCGQPKATPTLKPPLPGHIYPAPPETGDGWETASLGEVGVNEHKIDEAVRRIDDGALPNVHGMLIVKDGKLAFERYWGGYAFDYSGENFRGAYVEYDADTIHNQASVTKAITSALVGIAIERGFLEGVDQKLFDFFPQYEALRDEEKDKITLLHLLTMTSGLEWNEMEVFYDDTSNDLIQLFMVGDPVSYILSKPVVAEPGSRWYYSGGDVNLLGEIIQVATGLRMDDFAQEHLFKPLGITAYEWDFIQPDFVHASGNVKLRPRDVAKFGYLYLNDGVWQGQCILSPEWVADSTRAYSSFPGSTDGYGYQWLTRTYVVHSEQVDAYSKAGWGGQLVRVFPSLDMVLVFTGGNYATRDVVGDIITQYVLPAVLPGP